ncbi:hypothetical protein [Amycolatopsis benzoatilytica]|uniref:hypothetical protein n=1 Tax=Amycolatopsis benzoatilytica TaxID=346045 RepID=UPI00036052BA|nr:hypothetical protein [Amycolatopsis benzoatilytica]
MRNPGRFVTRSTLAAGRPARHPIVAAPVALPGLTGSPAAALAPVRHPVDGPVSHSSVRGSLRSRVSAPGVRRAAGSLLAVASARVLTVLATVLAVLAGTTATAFADQGVARAETAAGFGMLGPVGLVAVGFGIVGMALGVVRQRRKARAKVAEAAAGISADEATRPLEPVQQS